MKLRFFILLLAATLISGCSMFGGKEELNPPEKLQPVIEKVKFGKVWKASSGKILKNNKQIQPILVDTTLYAVSSAGVVSAFDAETGDKLWSRKLKLKITAGIGYGDGLLLAGTEDGEVVALYASNGNPAWVADARGGVLASPAGGQNVVVVPTSGDKLVGLSATDGTIIWTLSETTPRLLLRGRGRPLVVSDVILAGFDNGKLMLIRLDNGQRLWEVRVGDSIGKTEIERLADVDGRPVLIDETVYSAAYQSRVMAIDAPSAKMVWENEISTSKDMDADESNLYVVGENDVIYAINRESGETVWEQDELLNRKLTPPAVINRHIVVGDYQGYLHVINSATGEIDARVKTGSEFLSQPVTRGNSVWVQTLEGNIFAFQLSE
ncbi:MAG: outer membrane protein assembly factor BamB [Gammaproteobacteria bacterium]|nr:outer membrane protein assembly factor BamB [Gammaproteobacteria bacterium]